MARVFITGSTEGIGRAAAQSLMEAGHAVVLHARSKERAASLADLKPRSLGVVVGDLRSADHTRRVADQVNAIGGMDAVVHNAGVYGEKGRNPTPEDHAGILAVNTLAPYMLTALIARSRRLVYLSSGLHRGGEGSLEDLDWTRRRWDGGRAYAESKLHVVALACALSRRWPEVFSNAVDPGWVRTRMGGAGAPVDLNRGQRTQTWLAVSDDAAALVSGRYWRDLRQEQPHPQAKDEAFQEELIARLGDLTGVALP